MGKEVPKSVNAKDDFAVTVGHRSSTWSFAVEVRLLVSVPE